MQNMHLRSPTRSPFFLHKLVKHLDDDCYFTTGHTQGFFCHLTRPPTFNLIVENFGAKIVREHNADHLINILKKRHY